MTGDLYTYVRDSTGTSQTETEPCTEIIDSESASWGTSIVELPTNVHWYRSDGYTIEQRKRANPDWYEPEPKGIPYRVLQMFLTSERSGDVKP